jgi:hypothetical protein
MLHHKGNNVKLNIEKLDTFFSLSCHADHWKGSSKRTRLMALGNKRSDNGQGESELGMGVLDNT